MKGQVDRGAPVVPLYVVTNESEIVAVFTSLRETCVWRHANGGSAHNVTYVKPDSRCGHHEDVLGVASCGCWVPYHFGMRCRETTTRHR